eukprot:c18264_g1_i1 orf=1-1341(-)
MMALRRDSLRVRLLPARSIEETGLDPSLYGGIMSPHGTLISPGKEPRSTTALRKSIAESSMAKERLVAQSLQPVCSKCHHEEKSRFEEPSDVVHLEGKEQEFFANNPNLRRRERKGRGIDFDFSSSKEMKQVTFVGQEENVSRAVFLQKGLCKSPLAEGDLMPGSVGLLTLEKDISDVPHGDTFGEQMGESRTLEEAEVSQAFDASLFSSESVDESPESTSTLQPNNVAASNVDVPQKVFSRSIGSSKMEARSRWKRAAHSVKFINHLSANVRLASTDLIEDQQVTEDDAGGVGAAAFEGARTVARVRSKGRKGMEGLLVQQDRGYITLLQDFYVACLKMPIGHFLVGVFLAPLVLGLLFTPLYLLDVHGLNFNGVVPEDATTSPLVSARQRCLAFLNIFLYALSLSTTFGGAPVAARSPFCLLVANMNTLLAQFLFVFLSGAVFAR